MKRLSKMFKKEKFTAVMLVICLGFTLAIGTTLTRPSAVQTTKKVTKTAKVKKPGNVTGLKKVKVSTKWDGYRNVSSAKIKYKKVKDVSGYQIRIYSVVTINGIKATKKGYDTPLLYAKTTKKTTYTIQNLIPNHKYTIKVRAYKKGKNGKMVYGKTTSIKITTSGQIRGTYYTCGNCLVAMPQNGFRMTEHGKSVYDVHGEIHAGGTLWWR